MNIIEYKNSVLCPLVDKLRALQEVISSENEGFRMKNDNNEINKK